MLNWLPIQKIQSNPLFGLLLIAALLFSAQHLVMHDIEGASGGPVGHQECQLNHLPCAQLPVPLLVKPLVVAVLLLETQYNQFLPQTFIFSWLARAPPLN